MLALVDTFHLMSSALTFSIANLSPAYSNHAWYYIVPYSLPIAQVCIFSCLFSQENHCCRQELKELQCWFVSLSDTDL